MWRALFRGRESVSMTDPIEHLVERIQRIVDEHLEPEPPTVAGNAKNCDAEAPDRSRRIAEQIVYQLGLKPETLSDFRNQLRYVSAWFDQELTILEGAE